MQSEQQTLPSSNATTQVLSQRASLAPSTNADAARARTSKDTGEHVDERTNRHAGEVYEFFASCAMGFEELIKQELMQLGIKKIRPLTGRVVFFATREAALQFLLNTRLSSRVVCVLAHISAASSDILYTEAVRIPWEAHIEDRATIKIDAHGVNTNLKNSQFSALRVKDAICDRMLECTGARPAIDTSYPDLVISLRISGDKASVGLDLSKEALFRRGWEAQKNTHKRLSFLRADYAAALLAHAGWEHACTHTNPSLYLLFPQSGTIAMEALCQALNLSPHIMHKNWGLNAWKQNDTKAWEKLYTAMMQNSLPAADANMGEGARTFAREHEDAGAHAESENALCKRARVRIYLCDEEDAARQSEKTIRYMMRASGIDERAVSLQQISFDAYCRAYKHAHELGKREKDTTSSVFIVDASGIDPSLNATSARVLHQILALAKAAQSVDAGTDVNVHADANVHTDPLATTAASPNATDTTISESIFLSDELMKSCLSDRLTADIHTRLGNDQLAIGHIAQARSSQTPVHTTRLAGSFTNGTELQYASFDAGAQQFADRLKKMAKERKRWAEAEDISCYRVYDADLSDYACVIDVFESLNTPNTLSRNTNKQASLHTKLSPEEQERLRAQKLIIHISEYQAPKTVDPLKAKKRLIDVVTLAQIILQAQDTHIYLTTREKSKGGSQYHKDNRELQTRTKSEVQEDPRAKASRRDTTSARREPALMPDSYLVDEGGLTFELNFSLRHDCGIFLDLRTIREEIREMAKRTKGSKRFLNLFAYTGTASCYAADGGAHFTTSVDMSAVSLAWARRNMERNGFVGEQHEFIQADVLRWIQEARHSTHRWDLILCDVPTFSNSNRMHKRTWDVQRDHAEFIISLSRLLTKDGRAIFCCNLKNFKLESELFEKTGVVCKDITQESIPEDFKRHHGIHHAWIISRKL